MILLKMGAEVLGAISSALVGILAAGESTAITTSAVVAVLGFGGVLVRQIVNNQKLYIGIIAGKDKEISDRDDIIHEIRWEMESMRYRIGERTIDPGPYVPRRPPAPHGAPP